MPCKPGWPGMHDPPIPTPQVLSVGWVPLYFDFFWPFEDRKLRLSLVNQPKKKSFLLCKYGFQKKQQGNIEFVRNKRDIVEPRHQSRRE